MVAVQKQPLTHNRGKLMHDPASSPHPNKSTKPSQPAGVMHHLWRKMTSFYADKWTSKYGPDPDSSIGCDWAEALAYVKFKQIKYAISACLTRKDSAWPPTLPEFL